MEFTELFDLSPNDYSIDMLKRLFGGIIDVLKGEPGATGEDANNLTILSTLIGLVNQFCALLAVIVVAFTTYTVVFDTAADGTAFGSGMDTKYTILRVVFGVIAFIPVAGGFSVAQLVAMYLMIGGSAFGDVVWKTTSDDMVAGRSLLHSPEPISGDDFKIRGEFAEAMEALTAGFICQIHMNRIAETVGATGAVAIQLDERERTQLYGSVSKPREKSVEVYFKDEAEEYGAGDNLCGSSKFKVVYSDPTSGSFNLEEFSFAEQIDRIVFDTVYVSTKHAVWEILRPAAEELANDITAANGHTRVRNRVEVENAIRAAVNAATAHYTGNVGDDMITDAELKAYQDSVLSYANDSGWVFAANWQRGLAAIYMKLADVRIKLEIDTDKEDNLADYFSATIGSILIRERGAVSSEQYEAFSRDRDYLRQFEGFVVDLSKPEPGNYITTMERSAEAGDSGLQILNWLYSRIIELLAVSEGESSIWTDPMVDVQQVGNGMILGGGAILGASFVVDWIPIAGGTLSDYVFDPVGWGLVIAGILFVTVIPLTPLIYFLSAVFSWILLCIEAMFALPIACLVYFAPAREPSLIGPWQKIVLTLFGLLLRPAFTVVGLIACLLAARIGLDLLFRIFQGLFALANPGAGYVGSIFAFIGMIYVFLLVTVILMVWCSALITELGDSALGWIGAGVSNLGRAPIAERTVGTLNPAQSVASARPMGLPSGGGAGRPNLAKQQMRNIRNRGDGNLIGQD